MASYPSFLCALAFQRKCTRENSEFEAMCFKKSGKKQFIAYEYFLLKNKDWLCDLTILIDIMRQLNNLNL